MSYIKTKYNCLVDGSNCDLGQINSSNSLSIPVSNPTNSKSTILYGNPTEIKSTDMVAKINGQITDKVTTYTFGPAVPGRWVGVGDGSNSIVTSTDGITWQGLGNDIFNVTINGAGKNVAWNGKMWVAVGSAPSYIATSNNGISWTAVETPPFTCFGLGIAWNGSYWIAVGQNGILDNNTGVVSDASGVIAKSTDGLIWDTSNNATTIFSSVNSIAWNGSMWVAVGTAILDYSIAYSDDGISWTGTNVTPGNNNYFLSSGYDVAWNGKMWIVVGSGYKNISYATSIAYSYDGITWTSLGATIFSLRGLGVAWNGSIWIAVGAGQNTIAYSYNGLTWTPLSDIFSTDPPLYGNGTGYGISWNGNSISI